jgi:two-component system, cell cycle sensor histidine kinase and response regulator CckA
MPLKTVHVPDAMAPMFAEAEEFVGGFFDSMQMDPSLGTIHIGGRRYVLVSADSLSVGFRQHFAAAYPRLSPDVAHRAAVSSLYDIAFLAGRNDAISFHRTTGVDDPVARLSAGPVHFSYAGWARVHIHGISRPDPDPSYRLCYDHPNSFEADAWLTRIEAGEILAPTHPVCAMSAGYSAGWCTESFGMPLEARELSCRARGDACCRFVMAPKDSIGDVAEAFVAANPDPAAEPVGWSPVG